MFEAEFVPDQLEFFPAIILASWVDSYRSFVSYYSTISDLLVIHLRIGTCHFRSISFSFCSQHAPTRPEIFVALRSIREVRQRMSTVADSSLMNVTNLRDVIDVPVPVIDVEDSSLRVPSLLSDESTLVLSGILSTNSVMIPIAPVALPMPENVSIVGESLIPLVDSNRIPTAGTLNLSDSVPCNVMPLVYETVKQYATGPSSTILVLTRGSSRKQVKQVIANIQSPLHGYHHRETIDITYASEFQNLLMILYPHDEAKRNSCRLWRDWSPASFCEHLKLVFPDVKNATDKSFVQCISGMEFAYNLYDVTLELNFSVILQEIYSRVASSILPE